MTEWQPMEAAPRDGRMMLGQMPNDAEPLPMCWGWGRGNCGWDGPLNETGPLLSLNETHQPIGWADLPAEHVLSGTYRDDFGFRGWRGTHKSPTDIAAEERLMAVMRTRAGDGRFLLSRRHLIEPANADWKAAERLVGAGRAHWISSSSSMAPGIELSGEEYAICNR